MTRMEAICILASIVVVTYVYRHPKRVELACPPSTVIHEPEICVHGACTTIQPEKKP